MKGYAPSAFVLVVFLALNCGGATYYMATNGNNANAGTGTNIPWATLTKAAAAMRPGDALFIRGGTYDVNHAGTNGGTYQYFSPNYFTANGASVGTQASQMIISNYPGEAPLFINANLDGNGVAPIVLGFNSWIRIFGLSFSNCNLSSVDFHANLTNCELAYCTLMNSATNKRGGMLTMGDNCLSNYFHHNLIYGCWSSDQVNAQTGRQGESGDVVTFGPATWNGDSAYTNTMCRYNMFASNTIYWGGHSAFNPQGSRDCYFIGNIVHNEVWISWPDYNQLGGHRVVGAFSGWNLFDGNDFSFAGNPIANDGAEGLGIFGQYNIVRRNRIHHNENFGLTLYDKAVGSWRPNTNHIYNNVFAHNALGQMSQVYYYTNSPPITNDLSGSKCVVFFSGSTNNIFVNNVIAFNGGYTGTNGIEHRGTTGTSDANAFTAYTNWFNHISGDPLFLTDSNDLYYWGHLVGNPFDTNINYGLQSGSPCIDAGAWLTTAAGGGSGTSIAVADSWYFWEGVAVSGTSFPGDTIQLRGQTATATITAIDRSTHTLTLNTSLTWTNGQGVALAYNGSAPDMGAFEFSAYPTQTITGSSVISGNVTIR